MKTLILFVLVLFMNFSFSQQVKNPRYKTMLNDLLDHSVPELSVYDVDLKKQDVIYLDAREKQEYEVSHIKGAKWIGYDDFKLDRVSDIDKNAVIIVYCSVGYRSEKITEKLIANGFTNVQNLYGGIFEWVNGNRPVYEDDSAAPTKKSSSI